MKKGYLATSMDDIVTESKVSKTNIYYYFKSKEELLTEIIRLMVEQYSSVITYIAAQTELPVMERLHKLLGLLTEQDTDCLGGCPFLTLYTQTPPQAEEIRQRIGGFFQSQLAVIEQLIREGTQTGELKADLPVQAVSALILSTVEGALFLRHAGQDESHMHHSLQALAVLLK
ncbi:TetR family transcriptional regulator [Paenibacillus albidus]|uniref:TetR family transcriptional regulator n=1 Tax=Paenibacillus albidus TaxID=2041023 RepID=A0A917FDK5_9BACL|nr:TetR family transcriptional regulator [Paenibacillus albidus]